LTDFLALRLFCFNIRQHGRQILYFKLYVGGCKFHYRRPTAAGCASFIYINTVYRFSMQTEILVLINMN